MPHTGEGTMRSERNIALRLLLSRSGRDRFDMSRFKKKLRIALNWPKNASQLYRGKSVDFRVRNPEVSVVTPAATGHRGGSKQRRTQIALNALSLSRTRQFDRGGADLVRLSGALASHSVRWFFALTQIRIVQTRGRGDLLLG